MRTCVLGHVQKSIGSEWSCFRALIPTAQFAGVEDLQWLRDGLTGTLEVATHKGDFRAMFMYPCRGGALLNFVGLYEDLGQDDPSKFFARRCPLLIFNFYILTLRLTCFTDWRTDATREEVQSYFAEFHPKFQLVLAALPPRLLRWQMRYVPRLPTWVRGRAVLMGDAAHGTLPTMGQGAAMAIEEAGALGALFPMGTKREDVGARLKAYEALRKERGEFVGRESVEQAKVQTKAGEYHRCAWFSVVCSFQALIFSLGSSEGDARIHAEVRCGEGC
jgi:salicylate hydroxylase